MTTTLSTGANRGLCYETARRLLEAGHTVWVGSRDESRRRAAVAAALGAKFVQLDVNDDDSVAAAAAITEADGGLDVLIDRDCPEFS